MNRPIPILLLVFLAWCALLSPVCAQSIAADNLPAAIVSVQQMSALTNAQASHALPVHFKATVTFCRPSHRNLFVMDSGNGVYVTFGSDIGLEPGDRVEVIGVTEASFRPTVLATTVRFIARGTMPPAKPARFEDLIRARWDSHVVEVTGHVLAAAVDQAQDHGALRFQIQVPGGLIDGVILHPGQLEPEDLLESEVRLTGVAGGAFDGRLQMVAVWLDVNSGKDVVILHKPEMNPWALPVTPPQEVVYAYRENNDRHRVKIAGTLTYFEPGALAVVERDGISTLVQTRSSLPLHAGTGVEATGFPETTGEDVRLIMAVLRPVLQAEQVQPKNIEWEEAAAGRYAYSLVSMEGRVVAKVQDPRFDFFVILSEGHLFSASLRNSSADASESDTVPTSISVGSWVNVKGVCFIQAGTQFHDRMWFDLRMRSLTDMTVMQQPAWWTVTRLGYAILLLALVILGAVSWASLLRRQVRRQTAVIQRQRKEDAEMQLQRARQQQQRGEILEKISRSAPLAQILQDIQAMVSFALQGSQTWIELETDEGFPADGPDDPSIVFQEIVGHDGSSLGRLLTRPSLFTNQDSDIEAALQVGVKLAELAIETRRLYHDLRHRSEHDLLTDVPNRFSMERELDRLLLAASRNGSPFGLIYVDLDRFKQVNDRYGHSAGDLYLQAVARRMKMQLRSGDVLARIGGDEFIALVAISRSHIDVQDIAMRLDRCFDEPFEIDGFTLQGSASMGIAIYPEDGLSKEDLQRSADARMYAHKQAKGRHERHPQQAMVDEIEGSEISA